VRTLLLLYFCYTVTATAEALGTYRREMARIGVAALRRRGASHHRVALPRGRRAACLPLRRTHRAPVRAL